MKCSICNGIGGHYEEVFNYCNEPEHIWRGCDSCFGSGKSLVQGQILDLQSNCRGVIQYTRQRIRTCSSRRIGNGN